MTEAATTFRTETDLIGSRTVPSASRFGVHTVRAVENFPRIGPRVADVPEFAQALGMVKLAALRANVDCEVVAPPLADALERACADLIWESGGLREELVVPLVQGGAGTSTNMNVNEVLANRALELLGHPAGAYEHCHPNDHVNRSQSTNDVYPTALRVALLLRHARVGAALGTLADGLRQKAELYRTPKLGRTQLQDAVPIRVGDELESWADGIWSAREQLDQGCQALFAVNLGGTAVGTGLTAPAGYRDAAIRHLTEIAGLPFRAHPRLVSATTDPTGLVAYSGALRCGAVALAKVANDLRLLASGPRAGLGEVTLPPVQAGSSMMPGKVNPVIPEFVNQLAFRIHGADATIVMALSAGQLQLNAMLPVAAAELFEAQDAMRLAAETLCDRCVAGLAYREQRVRHLAGQGLDGVSRLAATAGHAVATEVAGRTC